MYRIGIDLGGTNIAAGVVDESQHIVAGGQRTHRRGARRGGGGGGHLPGGGAGHGQGGHHGGALRQHRHRLPGTCDGSRGVVVRAYNLGWFNVPVCDMVTARLGLPLPPATTPTARRWQRRWRAPPWAAAIWCW